MNNLVNASELSLRLKVTRETILVWARQGIIPCLRATRRPVLFDPVEVEKALRKRAAEQANEPPEAGEPIYGPCYNGQKEKSDEVKD